MIMRQSLLLENTRRRRRRQMRTRTNAAGRLKEQRVRKLRVQHLLKESSSSLSSAVHKGTLLDQSDNLKMKSIRFLSKNTNYSANDEQRDEKITDKNDKSVSNADYFNAIIHAIVPGPLDIPALYHRTDTISPDISKNDASSSLSPLSVTNIDNKNSITSTTIKYLSNKRNATTIRATTIGTIIKITEIPLISVNYTITNCTLYSGIYWNTTTTTAIDNCNSDNGKQFFFHFISLMFNEIISKFVINNCN
uniref:Uncharacterized protein n=1 Tax=Onchocerca volvulus TaxID=6282 RepID=A0A8R1XL13_ONCVO